jgi:hypothetical protein
MVSKQASKKTADATDAILASAEAFLPEVQVKILKKKRSAEHLRHYSKAMKLLSAAWKLKSDEPFKFPKKIESARYKEYIDLATKLKEKHERNNGGSPERNNGGSPERNNGGSPKRKSTKKHALKKGSPEKGPPKEEREETDATHDTHAKKHKKSRSQHHGHGDALRSPSLEGAGLSDSTERDLAPHSPRTHGDSSIVLSKRHRAT